MTQTYQVAGHLFRLEMSSDSAIWPLLKNYQPFVVESSDSALFTVHMVLQEEPLYREEASLIMTDKSDEDMPRIELYNQDGGYLFRMSMFRDAPICMEMLADKAFTKASVVVFPQDRPSRFPVDNALMLMYAFATSRLKTLEMHASVTVLDGKGHIFLGRSGTGKSTHSRQWLETFEDAWLLNDDNPIIRIVEQDGKAGAVIYGSPWSGKTPCYKQEKAPVAGIVLLRQHPENLIRTLSLPEAYAAIYSSCSGLRILHDHADGIHETVAQLAQMVPCLFLENLPNHEAAMLCHDTIVAANQTV